METLNVSKANALEAFRKGSNESKDLLKNLFGEQVFSQKITDRVKTFEDACEVLGISPEDVLHSAHSNYLKDEIKAINAFSKMTVITRALNEGWEPDWSNDDECKYYPWFNMAGPGVSFDHCAYVSSNSTVGSRFCFKSSELAEYAGNIFTSIYADFMKR